LDGWTDLGAFDRKSWSEAGGVNDLGQVVGYSDKFRDRGTLFLALPPTYELLNVDELLDPEANDSVALARWYASILRVSSDIKRINNPFPGESFGQIGGNAAFLDNTEEAYILTPVPPEE
jgi:hypothetical protein